MPSITSPVPSLVEVATLEVQGWVGRTERQGREVAPGETNAMRGHAGDPTPSFWGGCEERVGGERRSFLRHALPSKPPAGRPPPPPQPCTPRHHPEESDCLGTGDMVAAEKHRTGLTGELVGVARGKACVTPAGVGRGLETGVT